MKEVRTEPLQPQVLTLLDRQPSDLRGLSGDLSRSFGLAVEQRHKWRIQRDVGLQGWGSGCPIRGHKWRIQRDAGLQGWGSGCVSSGPPPAPCPSCSWQPETFPVCFKAPLRGLNHSQMTAEPWSRRGRHPSLIQRQLSTAPRSPACSWLGSSERVYFC